MATTIKISAEDKRELESLRWEHEHPRVRQKLFALYLKACGETHVRICELVGISKNTLRSYLAQYKEGGLAGASEMKFYKPEGELQEYAELLRGHFEKNPPATAAEAREIIRQLTGITKGATQVRAFMHSLGMSFRKTASIPAKANPAVQEEFKKNSLCRGWTKPVRVNGTSTLSIQPTLSWVPFLAFSGASSVSL